MSTLYDRLLDLIFPPRCPGCRTRGILFCAGCLERCRRLRVDPPVVRKTSRGLLTTAVGLYHYDTPVREAIHMLKYRRRRALAGPLGALIAEALPQHVRNCAAVVPVPLHPSRVRERGFNQSAVLASAIAVALHKPVVQDLRRTRSTAHQVGLGPDAREANVRGAFAWVGGAAPPVVLLLDDVLTTGATMRECARALRAAGVREVHGLALAAGG
jgi:ComF family protein